MFVYKANGFLLKLDNRKRKIIAEVGENLS